MNMSVRSISIAGVVTVKKLSLIVAAGVGYVLGARAGRERYEQIKSAVTTFWWNPKVQQTVDTVETQAKHAAADVSSKVADVAGDTASMAAHKAGATVSKLSDRVQGTDADSDAPPPAPSEGLGDELVGPPPVPGGSVFEPEESGLKKNSATPKGNVAGDNEGDPPSSGGPFGGK